MANEKDKSKFDLDALPVIADTQLPDIEAVSDKKEVVSSELTAKEKLAIEAEVRKEIAAEIKAEKRAAFKQEAKKRVKKEMLFSDAQDDTGSDLIAVTLNLCPVQPCITLDGRKYLHGKTYRVKKSVAQVINDIQFRGWKEESARLGEDMNAFYGRQKMNAAIGPTGVVYQ